MYKDLSKQKNKGRKKTLNINNTDNYYNLTLESVEEQSHRMVILPDDAKKIHTALGVLRNSEEWLNVEKRPTFIYIPRSIPDIFESGIVDIMEMGVDVTYLTRFPVSDKVLDTFAKLDLGKIVYQLGQYPSKPLITNVIKAYEATRVSIDMPVILPNITPYDVIKAMSPFGTSVDNLEIDFPPLHEKEITPFNKSYYYMGLTKNPLWHCYPKSQFDFIKSLQRSMSAWGIHIVLTYHSEGEKKSIEELVAGDRS